MTNTPTSRPESHLASGYDFNTLKSKELEVPQAVPVEMIGTYQETYAVLYGLFKSSSLDLGTSYINSTTRSVNMHVPIDTKNMPFYEQAKAKLLETYKSLFDITIIEEHSPNRRNAVIVGSAAVVGLTVLGLAGHNLVGNLQSDGEAATAPSTLEIESGHVIDDGAIVCEGLILSIPAGKNLVNATVVASDGDPGSNIVGYEIDFGDGTGPLRIDGTEIGYVFDGDGRYSISASVLAETEWGTIQKVTSPNCEKEVDLPMPFPPPTEQKVEETDRNTQQDTGVSPNNTPKQPQMDSNTENSNQSGGDTQLPPSPNHKKSNQVDNTNQSGGDPQLPPSPVDSKY